MRSFDEDYIKNIAKEYLIPLKKDEPVLYTILKDYKNDYEYIYLANKEYEVYEISPSNDYSEWNVEWDDTCSMKEFEKTLKDSIKDKVELDVEEFKQQRIHDILEELSYDGRSFYGVKVLTLFEYCKEDFIDWLEYSASKLLGNLKLSPQDIFKKYLGVSIPVYIAKNKDDLSREYDADWENDYIGESVVGRKYRNRKNKRK